MTLLALGRLYLWRQHASDGDMHQISSAPLASRQYLLQIGEAMNNPLFRDPTPLDEKRRCFVIMPFSSAFDEVYADHI
jgi:hypothetical protein